MKRYWHILYKISGIPIRVVRKKTGKYNVLVMRSDADIEVES